MSLFLRGGPQRPPFVTKNRSRLTVLTLIAATGGALCVAPFAVSQPRQRRRAPQAPRVQFVRPPRLNPIPRPRPPKTDPAVLQALRRMVRPTQDYSGEQVTQTFGRNGSISQQRIYGDTGGRIRLDYESPAYLAGDVMIRGPQQYRYLSQRKKTLQVSLWPTSYNEADKREFENIRNGKVPAAIVGNEIVAGRSATIIEERAQDYSKKFWIDTETGIQLKIEVSGPGGLISRTYLASTQIGPTAGVTRQMFNLQPPNNFTVETADPDSRRYNNLSEATPDLPFAPLVPTPPPDGFHLSGVWVSKGNPNQVGSSWVLLRYSNGVEGFSLFERQNKNAVAPPRNSLRPRRFRGGMVHWREPLPNGGSMDATYIGHLMSDQVGLLHDSLR